MRNKHPKRSIARKLTHYEKRSNGSCIFDSRAWQLRKASKAKKVARQQKQKTK